MWQLQGEATAKLAPFKHVSLSRRAEGKLKHLLNMLSMHVMQHACFALPDQVFA